MSKVVHRKVSREYNSNKIVNVIYLGILLVFLILPSQATAIDLNFADDGLSFIFQNDSEYTMASDDDVEEKGFLFLGKPGGKKQLISFGKPGDWIKGEGIEILEAELRLYYYDEWWTQNIYSVSISRSLDGTINSFEKSPESSVLIYGDKFSHDRKTQRPSWISFPIQPATIIQWTRDESQNKGIVLQVTDIVWGEDKQHFGLWFKSCSGDINLRPKLYVKYRLKGNGPPTPPKLPSVAKGWQVYNETNIEWSPSIDPNGDKISYEIEEGIKSNGAILWNKANVVFIKNSNVIWQLTPSKPPKTEFYLRVRAVDPHGAKSNWSQIGPFFVANKSCTVWGTHGNYKILPNEIPHEDKRVVRINAAKNEWEPFQIIVSPHSGIKGLTIRATSLINNNGDIIPAPTLYSEHNVNIQAAPNKWGGKGLWPDALVPLIHPLTGKPTGGQYGGSIFDIPFGQNKVFWADVFIPSDSPAGIYKGDIIVTAGGIETLIPIELKVWDFILPSPKHLVAIFQMYDGDLRHFHGVSKAPASDREINVTLPHLYEEELHQHYINNYSPITGWNYTPNGVKVSVSGDKLSVDWLQFDKIVAPYMDGKAYKDGVPTQWIFVPYWLPVKAGPNAVFTPRDDALLVQYVQEVVRHFKEKGWLNRAYYWVVDEPFIQQWKYNLFLHIAKIVRKAAPELKIFITDVHKEPNRLPKHVTKSLDSYVDTWDPTLQQVVAGWDVLPDYYLNRKKEGYFDMWCQTIMSAARKAPWPNLFPEYPMSFHRIWGWFSWKYGFQGIEWWQTILWWDTQEKKRIDPWTDPTAFRSDRPVNSEGRIFYPGTPDAIGGHHIPISSIRLKAIRETIEDYEYLHLLSTLGGDGDIQAIMETMITLSEEESIVMKNPMKVVPGGTPQERKITSWWEADGDALMEARARIAESIEKRTVPPGITF